LKRPIRIFNIDGTDDKTGVNVPMKNHDFIDNKITSERSSSLLIQWCRV